MSSTEQGELRSAQSFAIEAVQETLGQSSDVDSCLALVERVNALMDQAFELFRNDQPPIACRAGCNFCCHLRVMIYPHEAIALFRYLGSRVPPDVAKGIRQRLLDNAARVRQLTREGRVVTGLPCAFLVDGKCGAYEARPAACSSYHSLNRLRCEEAFEAAGQARVGIPVVTALRYVAATLDEGMDQALGQARLDFSRVELNTALAALIRNPALIQQWRSGRPLLKESADG